MSLLLPGKRLLVKRSFGLSSSLHPFVNKNFTIFWCGALLSSIGFWIQIVGQGWQVLQLTNSALLLGLVTLTATLPNIVFSLVGGVFVDRWNRRNVLMCTQTVFMTTAFMLGLLTSFQCITVWYIIVGALINGIFNAVGLPAWQIFITDLVPAEELTQGVALDFMQFNLSRIVGPALGGISIGLFGVTGSYYLNALSYVAVLLALLLIHTDQQRPNGQMQQSIWHGLGEGMRYIHQHVALQFALLLQFCLAFLVFPFSTLLPIVAGNIFHVGPGGLGLMNAAVGVGAFSGALLFLLMSQLIKHNLRLLVVLCVTGGCSCLALAYVPTMGIAFPILVTLGMCTVMPLAVTNTAIQVMTPEEMRGRILSVRIMITFGLAPFGNLLVGWIAQMVGVSSALALSGSCCTLVALLLAAIQKRYAIELESNA